MARAVGHAHPIDPSEQREVAMYREFSPTEGLNGSVECFWTTTSLDRPLRVLPDGCMDILLRRTSQTEPFRAEVVGTMTTAIVVDSQPGAEHVGVRFAPGEAFRLLAVPAHEVRDDVVPLEVAWGAMARELEAKVSDAGGTRARLSAIESVLTCRLRSAATPADFRVRKTIAAVRSEASGLWGSDIGSRQLRRLFETHVGISPKAFARVLRMQRAVSMIHRNAPKWAAVAVDCGYFDQSHLVREFHALVGLSPTNFARSRAMSVSSNPPVSRSTTG
jgi:hypothetical protein